MSDELIPKDPLDQKIQEIADQIYDETDASKTSDLVAMFNWNMSKKNIARLQKLNSLYDSITDQMVTRVEQRADQFSNSDLLDYAKAIQTAIDTNTKNLSVVDEPLPIVQHNTQINVNLVDKFDRESKQRILAAIQATIASAQKSTIETTPATEVAVDIDNAVEELNSTVILRKETE